MDAGHVISGVGHAGLIGWMLLGGVFQSEPLPFEVTEVSVISTEAFEVLQAAQRPPNQASDVAQPAQPEPQDTVTEAPQTDTPVATPAAPEAAEAPTPAETLPEVPQPQPPTEVVDTAPQLPSPPEDVAVLVPQVSDRPVPRPSERIAPEAVAQPDPEAAPDPVTQEAVREDDAGDTPAEPQDATAPEEATTQTVTEADTPSAAPTASVRPPSRPAAPPAQVAETQPTPTPPAADTTQDAVNAALAEALGAGDPEPAAPTGPPLSAGEKDALRVAVSACWNVNALSTEALGTTVIVTVAMQRDGKPIDTTIRMTGFSGGSDAAARQAFEAARRAILRCGASGFDLPVEKYDQWKDIEMTFNPERMRIK